MTDPVRMDAVGWRMLHRFHDQVSAPDCPFCLFDYSRADEVADRLRQASGVGRVR